MGDLLRQLQPLWTRSTPAPETSLWERARIGQDHAIVGGTTTLTVATPVEQDKAEATRSAVERLPKGADSPFASTSSTHFARLLMAEAFGADEPPVSRMPLNQPYVVFSATFDGGLTAYLEELATKAPSVVEAAWSGCVGYPGFDDVAAFATWLRRHRLPTNLAFAAVPRATVEEVRAALALKARIIELVVAVQHDSPQTVRNQLLTAFADVAGT